jgi:hypothetical protein
MDRLDAILLIWFSCALLAVMFVSFVVPLIMRSLDEHAYAKTVCPIWTDTLNVLLDSDSPITHHHGESVSIAGVRIYLGGYRSELGQRTDTGQRVNRSTQKRLKTYLAQKDAIEILKRAEKEVAV